MKPSRRFVTLSSLVVLTLFAGTFIAGQCICDPQGNCTYTTDSGASGCVNFRNAGSDLTCRSSGDTSSGGGGGGGPTNTAVPTATNTPLPTATPTPSPILRSFRSTAGVVGTFYDWCGPGPGTPVPCFPPDHHDVAGEHAVDLDAAAGEEVYFYDPRPGEYASNLRRAELSWTRSCRDGTGGDAAIITLTGIDSSSPSGGRYLAQAVYRHLSKATDAVTVDNATLLGTLAANASTNGDCWSGPHVHQGIGNIDPSVIFEHDVAGYQIPNCLPWRGATYPGAGWSVGYPFCYQIRWTG